MKKYTVYISHSTKPKNKLYKELDDFFQSINQIIFDDLDKLMSFIDTNLGYLNAKHSRCQPVKLRFSEHGKGISIHGSNSHVLILFCKQDYLINTIVSTSSINGEPIPLP